MNQAKIYQQASGKSDVASAKELIKLEAAKQVEELDKKLAINNWKEHPITKEIFASLLDEANQLDNEARELALIYQEEHKHTIINKLVRSATLRKVTKYAA
jgi:hypothetical protein